MSEVKVKGTTLATRFDYVRRMGPDAWERFVAALSPESRALTEEAALVSGWYPFERFVEVSRTIDDLFGDGDLMQCQQLGRQSFSRYSNSIYRYIFRALTIDFLVRRAQVAWSLHYDQGAMASTGTFRTAEGKMAMKGTLEGSDQFDPSHCHAVRGWISAAAEITGSKHVRDRCLACRARGDSQCAWQFEWD